MPEEVPEGKCQKCKVNDAKAPHTCPYDEEMQTEEERNAGDKLTLCNCCSNCEGECSDDV